MKITKEISYHTPEGDLAGTITSARLNIDERNCQPRESVRYTIAVDPIPSEPTFDFRVRVDYWASQANDLIRDAKRILGPQICELTNRDGEIVAEKLSLLEGKRVRFRVVHDPRPGHVHAYRKVVDLRPANEEIKRAA